MHQHLLYLAFSQWMEVLDVNLKKQLLSHCVLQCTPLIFTLHVVRCTDSTQWLKRAHFVFVCNFDVCQSIS